MKVDTYALHLLFMVLISWLIVGLLKVILNKDKKSFSKELFTTGGMPSGHSAVVMSLVVGVLFFEGLSTSFVIALVFAIVVLVDSRGVRWSVGEQAQKLNTLLKKKEFVKEIRGHTGKEVFYGSLVGIFVALLYYIFLGVV